MTLLLLSIGVAALVLFLCVDALGVVERER